MAITLYMTANAEYAEVLGGGSQSTTGTPGGRCFAVIQPKK
jgi:hypothetical protein